jgi:hypothetical protein
VLASYADQRAAVLEVGAQYLPAGKRLVPLRRGQAGQPGVRTTSAMYGERHTGSISGPDAAAPVKGPSGKKCVIRPGASACRPVTASAGSTYLGVGDLVIQQGVQLGGLGAGVA